MAEERREKISLVLDEVANDVNRLLPIVVHLAGQYLVDPNEINGWGILGFQDNTNSQDLGNVGAANLNRLSGGIVFPFDVKIKRFYSWHRVNNDATYPWGWVLARQIKNDASNTVSTVFMLDESFDRGTGQINLRDYGANNNRVSDLTNFVNDIIPAGETIILGVGSPTAEDTNRYVQIMSGYLEFKRV